MSGAFDVFAARIHRSQHEDIGSFGYGLTTSLSIPTKIRGKCLEDFISPPIKDGELKVREVRIWDVEFIIYPIAIGCKCVGDEDSPGFNLRIVLDMAILPLSVGDLGKCHGGGQQGK